MNVLFFILHILFILFGCSCNLLKEDSSNQSRESSASALLLANNANNESLCLEFSSSESNCILNPESGTTTCSEAEKSRLQTFINPKTARNNDSLEAFFACWSRCNLTFNSSESTCGGSKFYDNSEYRKAQRSFSTQVSKAWGNCMDRCNSGNSTEGAIQGVTFTGYGY